MIRPSFLAPLLVLFACQSPSGGSVPGKDDTGTPDGDADTCTVTTILGFTPLDGAGPVSTTTVIRVEVDGEATLEETTVSVTDGRDDVPFEIALADGEVLFTPEQELDAETTFTWEAAICGVEAGGSFTTGTMGDPPDPSVLDGAAYAYDLGNAEWVEPPGGENVFGYLFDDIRFLMGIQEVTDDTLDGILGLGNVSNSGEVTQDPCFVTMDFPPAPYDTAPYFSFGPADVSVEYRGQALTLHDTVLSGAFTEDGDEVLEGRLRGQLDLRDLGDGEQYCEYISYIGIDCTTCGSDGEPVCVDLDAQEVAAERIDGLHVEPVTAPGPDCG